MFRKMLVADLPKLYAIEQTSQGAPWNEAAFRACLDFGCDALVAEQEGVITGYIITSINADECHILNLCVALNHQRQGLGRRLLEHGLARVYQRGAKVAYLEVRRSNLRAIRLYESLKFLKIGERKDYYQTVSGPEDALVYAVSLAHLEADGLLVGMSSPRRQGSPHSVL